MITDKFIYLAPTFEDEGVEDEHWWVEYPGKVVARVLSEILQGLGCKVEEIYSEGEKGWEFNSSYERVWIWTRVSPIEDFLIVFGVPGVLDLTGRKKRVFAQLMERLDDALQKDGRFSNIRWYTKKQMDTGQWDYPGKPEEDRPHP